MTAATTPGKLGFRVLPAPPRLDDELVERFRGLASPNLADAMGRFNFMDPGIQSRSKLAALRPRRDGALSARRQSHGPQGAAVAEPGDIVVVATCGNTTSAVFGELMCHTAAAKKLGGIVVDGAIRDVEGITRLGFPAFSRSVSPGGCDKDGPGEINVPIACGNTVVMPGDIVVGDDDGVAVVPRDSARRSARRSLRR